MTRRAPARPSGAFTTFIFYMVDATHDPAHPSRDSSTRSCVAPALILTPRVPVTNRLEAPTTRRGLTCCTGTGTIDRYPVHATGR